MSRCFPFPPPGYEKKARTEGVDLLRKEKHKEKKHKKEKRDKEKKEGKEKKEKDRNDEKHREKKDRKEKDKHREKKKSKEDTSKETKVLPGETNGDQHNQSRLAGQVEGYKGEKINQKQDSVKLKRSTFEVKSAGEFEGYHKDKLSQINFARQVEANKGGILSQKQDSSKQKSSTAEVKPAGQFEGCNGERLSHNNLSFEAEKVPKFIQEVGPRVHDNNKRKGVQVVENLSGLDCKNGGTVKLVANDNSISLQGMNRTAEKRFGDRHLDEQASGYEARFKTLEVQNLPRTVQNKLEEMPNKFESIDTKKTDRKEKIKEKGSDVKKGEKRKKDQEKRSHAKSKDRNKEKSQGKNKDKSKERKKDEKVELIVNQDIDNHEMIDSSKTHFSCGQDIHLFHLPEVADSSGAEGNIRKRKELEANGFLHDNDVRPNKLQKTSFHRLENGVRLEHCRTSTLPSSSREEPNNSLKLGNSGKRLNGIVEPQQYSVRLTNPSLDTAQADEVAQVSHKRPHPSVDTAQADEVAQVSHKRSLPSLDTAQADEVAQVSHKHPHPSLDTAQADEVAQVSHKRPHPSLDTAQADEVAQVSHKRPHPSLDTAQADEVAQVSHKRPHRDSKYLSEVLTVPKLEELCDFDDQEWLFSSTVSESKKSRLGSPAGIETQLVWAEAVQIDSADVCALPYVIPY